MPYAYAPDPKRSARAMGRGLRISTRDSVVLCRAVRGMRLDKGQALLEGLAAETRSLGGKHYTQTSREVLGLLKSCAANAEAKGLDSNRLVIHASAHKGFTFHRPRRVKSARQKRKVTNLQVVLEVR